MALGFSQGLLGGLRQFGQGGDIPADPRQRNVMQQYGVTNPLLQQFGQSLGALTGQDMRSAADISNELYAKAIDPNTDVASKKEIAARLAKLGMVKEAMAINEDATKQQATQISESSAMQAANRAFDNGLITKEVRDNYLRGLADKTLTPQSVASGLTTLTLQNDAVNKTEAAAMQRANAAFNNGEINQETRDNILRGVAGKTMSSAGIESIIKAEKDKTVRAANLTKVAIDKYGSLKDTTQEAINNGLLTTMSDIKAVEENDKMILPSAALAQLEAAKSEGGEKGAAAEILLQKVKGGKIPVEMSEINSVLSQLNTWYGQQRADEKAAATAADTAAKGAVIKDETTFKDIAENNFNKVISTKGFNPEKRKRLFTAFSNGIAGLYSKSKNNLTVSQVDDIMSAIVANPEVKQLLEEGQTDTGKWYGQDKFLENLIQQEINKLQTSQNTGGLKVGDVIKGQRYKGGDRKDPANWEKV